MKKTTLQDLVKILKNDYLVGSIKCVKYNDDKSQVKVYYNDTIITLYYMNSDKVIGGWVEGSMTIISAGHLYKLVKQANEGK